MTTGYVKIYRSLLDKGYFSQSEYVHLWVYLIMKASYCDREFLFNNVIHALKAGQLITGRRKISKDTGIQESKVERILKCFKTEQQIEQQTNKKFRIITICNWEEYQQSEQQNEQPVNNWRTTGEQLVNTVKKYKKDKKEKNIVLSDDDFILKLKILPCYQGIDIDMELSKMDAWLLLPKAKGREKTRRFIVNWLNKIDKPITTTAEDKYADIFRKK